MPELGENLERADTGERKLNHMMYKTVGAKLRKTNFDKMFLLIKVMSLEDYDITRKCESNSQPCTDNYRKKLVTRRAKDCPVVY